MKNKFICVNFIFLALILLTSCQDKYDKLDMAIYEYRDTKDLVKFVYDNAQLLQKNGQAQIDYFKSNRSHYKTENYYLYVYKMDCTNVFHAGIPELEGKNLYNITDINGKKILQLILEELKNKNNPHNWVHFTWYEPGTFFPVPKSSCHFEVTTDDGEKYFVGAGLNYPQEEKEFIRIIVDSAADLLQEKGLTAIDSIASPLSQFNFRDVRTFVFEPNGKILISPIAGNNIFNFDLINSKDEIGHQPFLAAIKVLKNQDTVWQEFMAKNRYERFPRKKCLYLRKVKLDVNSVIVGAITNLPLPPWSE
ncbi:MAG: cache domain-containing protein [Candidatus Cloacimonetes bacterium]|nr:cache domain-containing protein [Candidatus Cloacimonadota bacterium]MCF7813074.1 cache domain-containing protein [Candidatus Cloacimonadota bacterium]MCF7867185.1 cache domain-containing protein [Candidatus Cloacimonadota bacterium]MCF7882629.1 cache domain-containing protein [Candidatus Cloacimonadota bacterium]